MIKEFRKTVWLGGALIVLLTLVAYLPAMHGGFIWNDDSYVTENHTLRSLTGLGKIWTRPEATEQYYPLVFTSFWAEYHLCKLQPFGYHFVNILLHALNAVLLWRVLRRLEVRGAWWIAAIFALHPVQVESVAWITERKNVLSGVFYLLALLAWFHFRPLTASHTDGSQDWRFYPLVILLFFCALLSKTVTLSLPAVIVLLIWWKGNQVERRDVLALVPLFVLGTALGYMTMWMEKHHVGAGEDWTLSMVQRCLLAGRALWFYVGKLCWPHPLTFIYPRWVINARAWWQYLFPMAALVVPITLWLLRRRIGRGPLVATLYFEGTLVPALGFFDLYPFRYSFVADHFQYLACIGPIALVVNAGAMIYRRSAGQWSQLVTLAAAAALLMLGVSTRRQGLIYNDPETLWRDTLAKNPDAWMAHNNLGLVLTDQGRVEEAIAEYRASLRIKPDHWGAHYNLANALVTQGKLADAITEYQVVLRAEPNFAPAHNNLGGALAKQGKVAKATAEFVAALRINPDSAEAHNNLGNVLLELGKVAEAVAQYREALRLRPDFSYALSKMAWILATDENANFRNGAEAVQLAERFCVVTGSHRTKALDVLAAAYAEAGRFSDAIRIAQKAVESASAAGQQEMAKQIQERLKLYQAGRPFHEDAAQTALSAN
jgi:tetratricopeptide (TPR) repeat protein